MTQGQQVECNRMVLVATNSPPLPPPYCDTRIVYLALPSYTPTGKQVRLLIKKTLSVIFWAIFILTFMSGLEYAEIS